MMTVRGAFRGESHQCFTGILLGALIVPSIGVAICLAIGALGVLPPRSPYVFLLGAGVVVGGFVELVAAPTAVARLIGNPENRSIANVLATIGGSAATLPSLALYLGAVLT